MKSTDMDKVNSLLNELDTLKNLTESTKSFKDKGLCAEICCKGKYLWFDKDISKEVFNTILRELNIQKEEIIGKLSELGVEYVE